jgi:hypothetical protein
MSVKGNIFINYIFDFKNIFFLVSLEFKIAPIVDVKMDMKI